MRAMASFRRLEDALKRGARPWELAVFFWLPVIVLGVVGYAELTWGGSLGDFTIFRNAATAVMHGASPYVAPDPARLARNDAFVYPPVTGLAFAPFALLPLEAARAVILLSGALAMLLALRLVRVSDWRCYGLAVATAPAVDAISIGALTPFLVLGAAAAWRFRHRAIVAGVAVAATAVAKLFLWPLVVWLIVTRRIRAAVAAVAAGATLAVGGWAVIGFAGLAEYPRLLHVLADVEAAESYSLAGLLHLTGRPATLFALAVAIGAVAAVAAARRDDRVAFAVAIAGSLLATPVLWIHYFALLVVPLGILRPRLAPAWLALLGFWLTPFAHSDGSGWKTAFALGLTAAIVAELLRGGAARAPEAQLPAAALRAGA